MDSGRVALVIEDDGDIRQLLEVVLRQGGFEVHSAGTASEGVRLAEEVAPDVITLDVGLPDFDGFEAARRIRLVSDAYIVMLTAQGEEVDTLLGLEAGADDYIVKPFRPRELRARISAMMRRPRGGDSPAAPATPAAGAPDASAAAPSASPDDADPADEAVQPAAFATTMTVSPALPTESAPDDDADADVLRHNGLVLDEGTRHVTVDGEPVDLTRTEFDLLASILASGGRVRTKGDLVRDIRSGSYAVSSSTEPEERAVEVHLGNLRRKLHDDPRQARWIQTVRGVGYRLAPPRD
ncbi:response regulator transcription factor [Clavibacter tessellarius]|uniref:DNA-binding response regulator n=1 Tax=Clavibacter tessellarius TaxID=31965 RepID=A0A225C8R5_9MICO|nr:response regulator transcription factor [Clavibacter michiganensis]MBT1635104.1 response regulator transcription factor [Clavibacter michiganensis]OQJ62120.1 DNA-binding response regulator [Clavibacter michiganensis subsp. tessellarius]UKF34880.1 response regulator transcription factor [Clavibacter michiganensis subsp. tessellarius]